MNRIAVTLLLAALTLTLSLPSYAKDAQPFHIQKEAADSVAAQTADANTQTFYKRQEGMDGVKAQSSYKQQERKESVAALPSYKQKEPMDSVAESQQEATDSIASKPKSKRLDRRFERFVKKFIDFNNYDTTYISPNRYNYAIMLCNNSIFESYSIGASDPRRQKISFASNPSYKIGAYFGWRWIFIGWTVDAQQLFGGKKNNSKKTEFTLNLYSSKLGVDFYYWKIGNDFKIKTLQGFTDGTSSDVRDRQSVSINFDGLQATIKGLNLYYIFNNRHFSYPAAFSQSTNQRKSAGSLLSGISYSEHRMTFDYGKLPQWILSEASPAMHVDKLEYTDLSLHFGYAYNWVFARNCLACLSIAPAVAYKRSLIHSTEEQGTDTHHGVNLDFITRAALVYNNAKYFAGLSWVNHTYDYSRRSLQTSNSMGTLQLYVGFNFGLKREYRGK